ncbi:ATP-binding cassette domain-containing protein [Flavobacteriales bacterium]|nr:ATP-binding cassette domain-containing protein [Flavobacteriales bacterium]
MSSTILEINKLSKKYKDVLALDRLNLKVEKGTVFGLLGPNGSGKTTTLGILLGVLRQSSGSYSWFENGDATGNRLRIGALLETPNFYPYLTAIQNLKIVAKIKKIDNPIDRIESVLKIVNLYDRRNSNFKTYSLGMKQRLAIAGALLNDPEVLVLDEPTNGLDPQGIAEIRELIIKIAKEGKTIIIASHILDEIEKVCTHVAILKFGDLIRQGTIKEIIGGENFVIIAANDMTLIKTVIDENAQMEVSKSADTEITIKVTKEMTTEMINQYFFDKGVVLSKLKSHSESLEKQFLEIIK